MIPPSAGIEPDDRNCPVLHKLPHPFDTEPESFPQFLSGQQVAPVFQHFVHDLLYSISFWMNFWAEPAAAKVNCRVRKAHCEGLE